MEEQWKETLPWPHLKTTLEALYNDLCRPPKYHNHSDRILFFLLDELSLVNNEEEKKLLKFQAGDNELNPGPPGTCKSQKLVHAVLT